MFLLLAKPWDHGQLNVSIRRGRCGALRCEWPVAFWTAVAEKLPYFAHFRDHVEVQVRNDDFVLIAAGLSDDLAARIAEIALAIKLADAPRLFGSNAINRADKITIRNRVSRLFKFPQVLGQSGYRSRWVEDNLSPIQPQDSGAFREMPVITDIHTHARILGLKDRIAKVSGREVKLFPESGMAVRNVVLAVFAQIAAVGVDDCRRVEVHTGHVLFVNRNNHHHFVLRRNLLHESNRRPFGNRFGQLVPAFILLCAEIRTIEKFLQAQDLRFLASSLFDQLKVLVDHRLPDLRERAVGVERVCGLNQGAADIARHKSSNSTVEERTIA